MCLLFGFSMTTATALAPFTAGASRQCPGFRQHFGPNATITLTNDDNQVSQTTTTDSSSISALPAWVPRNYTVSAAAPGFSQAKTRFPLTAGETRNVPLTVSVGSVSAGVTVTTQAPLLDTSDSRNQETLDEIALENLPLAARNPTALITLTPGVTGLGAGTATNFNPENYVDASANGRGQNGNSISLTVLTSPAAFVQVS